MSRRGHILLCVASLTVAVAWVVWIAPWRDAGVPAMAALPTTGASGATGARDVFAPATGPVSAAYHERIARLEQSAAAGDTAALLELGRAQRDAHDAAAAAATFARLNRLDPLRRDVWIELADARAAGSDWKGARDAMRAMLDLFPADPTAMYNLGASLANLGDAAGAREWWQRAAGQAADPDLAAAARQALAKLEGA